MLSDALEPQKQRWGPFWRAPYGRHPAGAAAAAAAAPPPEIVPLAWAGSTQPAPAGNAARGSGVNAGATPAVSPPPPSLPTLFVESCGMTPYRLTREEKPDFGARLHGSCAGAYVAAAAPAAAPRQGASGGERRSRSVAEEGPPPQQQEQPSLSPPQVLRLPPPHSPAPVQEQPAEEGALRSPSLAAGAAPQRFSNGDLSIAWSAARGRWSLQSEEYGEQTLAWGSWVPLSPAPVPGEAAEDREWKTEAMINSPPVFAAPRGPDRLCLHPEAVRELSRVSETLLGGPLTVDAFADAQTARLPRRDAPGP